VFFVEAVAEIGVHGRRFFVGSPLDSSSELVYPSSIAENVYFINPFFNF